MKIKRIISVLIVLITFTNCKNNSETNKTKHFTQTITNTVPQDLLELGCYAYQENNNSITFEITDIKTIITGKLIYQLAEKDINDGTFEGVLIDDILLGDYTFQSEGTTSRREVIFKISNNQLIEGYGDMDEEGICFINTDHVTYSSTMPLTKTNCKN